MTRKYAAQDSDGYDVTIAHTGRDGQPNTNHITSVEQLDSGTAWQVDPAAAVSTLRLPPGKYVVISYIYDANGDVSLLTQPLLDLTGPQEVDLDARLARPIDVTVPDGAAAQQLSEATVWVRLASGFTEGNVLYGSTFEHMYTGRIGADPGTGQVSSELHGEWLTPDGAQDYNLAWISDGQVMTGFSKAVTADQLATVRGAYASEADGVTSAVQAMALSPGGIQTAFSVGMHLQAPGELVTHYNTDAGIRWQETFAEGAGLGRTSSQPTAYVSGQVYDETWNRGVFTPSLGDVTRTQGSIDTFLGVYSDGDGRFGVSDTASQQTTLTRDGLPVTGVDAGPFATQFDHLPAAAATYQLKIDATRPAPAMLATHTTAVWTFKSAATNSSSSRPLPVWTVGLRPQLNLHNTALAGTVLPVPVIATPQAGADVGALTSLTVEASYDDGQTWRPTTVICGVAQVVSPVGTGYVSLRASAADSYGNAVTETIIRAYVYAPTA